MSQKRKRLKTFLCSKVVKVNVDQKGKNNVTELIYLIN